MSQKLYASALGDRSSSENVRWSTNKNDRNGKAKTKSLTIAREFHIKLRYKKGFKSVPQFAFIRFSIHLNVNEKHKTGNEEVYRNALVEQQSVDKSVESLEQWNVVCRVVHPVKTGVYSQYHYCQGKS